MNDNNRRFFSPKQKVAILREHLVEGKAVSDLCEKHRIHPTVFYQWPRQFFENGTAAFESKQSRSRVSDGYQKKLEALEENWTTVISLQSRILARSICRRPRSSRRFICLLTAALPAQGTAAIIREAEGGWFWLPPLSLWQPWATAILTTL